MAKVRKRKLPSGLIRFQAGYVDGAGQRRFRMFEKKSDAEAWLVEVRHDVARGTHTPGSQSPTVKDAAALWIKRCGEKRLEPMTVKGYEEHVDLHIVPLIGAKKLSEITVPAVNAFADQLREKGRSAEMIKRVVRSLGSIFKEARRRGLANTSPTTGLELDLPDREDPRPVIPSKPELQAIINAATGRWRPVILVAIFCGLRASELRGLRWADIDFDAKQLNLSQRADASHRIGKLKSKAAYRSIPCPPIVINALREWKLVCPKRDTGKKDATGKPVEILELAFPNGLGKVESHSNLLERGLEPLLIAAGLAESRPVLDQAGNAVLDKAGEPKVIMEGKYGMHSLRHACASLWIENGHNPKQIQRLMGHSSIKVTFDVYGHLFADTEADQRAAESLQTRLLGA
ncbi:integrase [Bradyrhizobium elkanii]|uniref:tyrosine-type recombinase/integrase n=1 Tax=Bradyrhizobium elkanii TaxID=29448 RepID=UPI0021679FA5|nr:site-specific integrase [Bradyrhizobium elkanii]MCS3449553.1 integrase [Bradyrhizobium elkanii]MCS3559304.1 integrase [Bradyrhizobium elkanii]MCW2150850.1 integrase [Bradyrhizobium elkanii]MCW2374581.1 integrase [Bradyrhizobium elkanii]